MSSSPCGSTLPPVKTLHILPWTLDSFLSAFPETPSARPQSARLQQHSRAGARDHDSREVVPFPALQTQGGQVGNWPGSTPQKKQDGNAHHPLWFDWDHLVMLIGTSTPPTRGSHSCITRQKAEANRLCEKQAKR